MVWTAWTIQPNLAHGLPMAVCPPDKCLQSCAGMSNRWDPMSRPTGSILNYFGENTLNAMRINTANGYMLSQVLVISDQPPVFTHKDLKNGAMATRLIPSSMPV